MFNINVAKMRVSVPSSLRTMLERPVQEACQAAESAYRGSAGHGAENLPGTDAGNLPRAGGEHASARVPGTGQDLSGAGLALLSAAAQAGRLDELGEILSVLGTQDPGLVRSMGLAGL